MSLYECTVCERCIKDYHLHLFSLIIVYVVKDTLHVHLEARETPRCARAMHLLKDTFAVTVSTCHWSI